MSYNYHLRYMLFYFEPTTRSRTSLAKSELIPAREVYDVRCFKLSNWCLPCPCLRFNFELPTAKVVWDSSLEKLKGRLAGWKRLYFSGVRWHISKALWPIFLHTFVSVRMLTSMARRLERIQRDFLSGTYDDAHKFLRCGRMEEPMERVGWALASWLLCECGQSVVLDFGIISSVWRFSFFVSFMVSLVWEKPNMGMD